MSCRVCDSVRGDHRISPGPSIWAGRYWVVEHAWPTSLLGWIVVVLQRHCEALHELSRDEWREFADIQFRLLSVLQKPMPLEKEYLACFAEKEGFRHLHFHVVPKGSAFDKQYEGTKAFHYINPDPTEVLEPDAVARYCQTLAATWTALEET